MDAEPSGHRSGRPNVAQCPRDASAGGHAAGSDLIEAFLKSPREIDVHARKGTCVRNTLPMFRGFATAKVLVSSIGSKPRKPFLRLIPSTGHRCPSCSAVASLSPKMRSAASCPVTCSWKTNELLRWARSTIPRTRPSIAPAARSFLVSSTSTTTSRTRFSAASEETYAKAKEIAEGRDVRLHTHLSETRGEVEAHRKKTGLRPVEWLEKIGFLGDRVTAAHCVWVTMNEVRALARCGTSVAHCPVSNMKLASGGVAPVPRMI